MRKSLVIILLSVAVSLLSFYAYQKLREVKIGSLESIVPDEIVYYIYSYNLDKKIKEFESSLFYQQISNLTVYKQFIEPKIKEIKGKLPFLSDFIEKDVAFVIVSLGDAEGMGDFLFMTRLDMKKYPQIKKQLAEFYLSKISKEDVSFKKYKGVKITTYNLPQKKMVINTSLLADVLLVSNNSDIIQKSIDLFKKHGHNSLLNNKNFQKTATRIKKDVILWGYQDYSNYFRQMMRQYISSESKRRRGIGSTESLEKIKPFMNLMNIYKDNIFYLDYSGLKDGLVLKTYSTFDRTKDESGLLEIIAYNKPVDKATLDLIPKSIISYYGGNQKLLNCWNFLKKILSSVDEAIKAETGAERSPYRYKDRTEEMGFEDYLKELESFLGVNIEKDILSLLGDNFGAVFVNIDDAELKMPVARPLRSPDLAEKQSMTIAFPQIYAFCELKDKAKMQDVMQRLTQNLADKISQKIKEGEQQRQRKTGFQESQESNEQVQVTTEEKEPVTLQMDTYKDVDIYRLELLDFPVDLLKPNYCILDKYIIVSLSTRLTQKIIDVYKDKGDSLSSNLDFKFIQNEMPPDYSNIMFFDFERLINNIRTLKFFNMFIDNLTMNAPRGFSKKDLDSILNVLSNISSYSFTNKMIDSDTMESSCYIKIKGL